MDLHVFFVSDHLATDIPPHVHNFFQLIYCKSGSGRITIRNTTYTAHPGTVYLAAPGVTHAIQNDRDLWLLECKFSGHGLFARQLQQLPDAFGIEKSEIALPFLQAAIAEGFSKKEHFNSAADANLLLFFIEILRMAAGRTEQTAAPKVYAHLEVKENMNDDCEVMMLNLLPFLEDHLSEKITLEMLANRVHFTKTYFIRRFKALWGCAPMQYVNRLRLNQAARQLSTTDDPIAQIGKRCGFASPHYFSRKFHEEFGLSPQSYRFQFKSASDPNKMP